MFIAFWAIVIGLLIAVPLGVYSAYRRDSSFDQTAQLRSFAVISMPPLVIAVLAAVPHRHAVQLLPDRRRSKYVAPWDSPVEHFENFFIPSLVLGLGLGGGLEPPAAGRHDPGAAERLREHGPGQGHLAAPRAVGACPADVDPVADDERRPCRWSALIGGAVVVETFFGPKGIGDRLVFAIQQNDLLVIQAIVAVLVVVVVVANLIVDLLYSVVDPRIRLARSLG